MRVPGWPNAKTGGEAAHGPDLLSDSLLWGHSGLLRRPRDTRWEKRTDIFHQRARSLLPDLPEWDFEEALTNLVRVHLGSYGPPSGKISHSSSVPAGCGGRRSTPSRR